MIVYEVLSCSFESFDAITQGVKDEQFNFYILIK
jgi:hypothetical protein